MVSQPVGCGGAQEEGGLHSEDDDVEKRDEDKPCDEPKQEQVHNDASRPMRVQKCNNIKLYTNRFHQDDFDVQMPVSSVVLSC